MDCLKKVMAVACFSTTCQSFNIDILSGRARSMNAHAPPPPIFSSCKLNIQRRAVPASSVRLNLFESLFQQQESNSSSRERRRSLKGSSVPRIPYEELDFLSSGFGLGNSTSPPFPYSIDLLPPANGKASNQASRLIIRHLEDEDITQIMPEVVREFGSLVPQPSTPPKPGKELADKVETYLFSLTVLIGLTQRVVRRQKGYSSTNPACPDHNVICLVEQTVDGSGTSCSEQIVGISELSWQPPNPNSSAPPFVVPFFMKTLISRFSPSRDETSSDGPKGYISNVLVWKTHRGRGYSRVLMAAMEGIAKQWGCDDVRLHVDANENTGRIARGLYWSLGYQGVSNQGNSKMGFEWMGSSMVNQGLYLVDGIPLLYLRKRLWDV